MSALVHADSFEHNGLRLFRIAVPLASGPTGEMQVALSREWKGGPGDEPLKLDAGVFEQMIANFNARENRSIPVDYDHRTFSKTAPSSEAAGWITGLSIRTGDDGPQLWAAVQWTPEAADKIKSGAFKFCSPAFHLDWKNPETDTRIGPHLLNVSLTNIPFQDGLNPIQLSMVGGDVPAKTKEELAAEAAAAAAEDAADGGADDAVEDPAGAVKQDAQPAADPPSPEDKPAAPLNPMPTAAENAERQLMDAFIERCMKASNHPRAAVIAALNDDADAIASRIAVQLNRDGTPAETRKMSMPEPKDPKAPVTDAVTAVDPAAAPAAATEDKFLQTEIKSLQETVKTLATSVETLAGAEKKREDDKAAAHEKRIQDRVSQFLQLGHIADAEREDAVILFRADFERADRAYSRGKVVPIAMSQAGVEPEHAADPKVSARADELKSDPGKATKDDLTKDEIVQLNSMVARGYAEEPTIKSLVSTRETRAAANARIASQTN